MRGGTRTRDLWSGDHRRRPWGRALALSALDLVEWGRDLPAQAWCNVCGWRGLQWRGELHSESAHCPCCRSIARDRFLRACWLHEQPDVRGTVVETSPRMGDAYRRHMARGRTYLPTDYDERGHRGVLRVDLQAMDLATASVDTFLTSHTLEHVPDTARALSELHRVLTPTGLALVLVPMPSGTTHVPATPEWHGDDTPVFWRFGWDLAGQLADAGLRAEPLVTADFARRVRDGEGWGDQGPDLDLDGLLSGAPPLTGIVSDSDSRLLGLFPSYPFVVWACRRS